MNTSEASSKQWIIAFGIAVATAVSYKMTRRHRGLHAHFLPIIRGLAVIGAVCMYPELLMMGIGLISALGACEKSFRRHFFWAMTHFGDVVRPLFNAASSLLKMIFQPIVIYICFKLTTTACKNLLPWNDKDLQDLEIIFAAVAQVSTLGVVCYHYYKWTTAGMRFSLQCWVCILPTLCWDFDAPDLLCRVGRFSRLPYGLFLCQGRSSSPFLTCRSLRHRLCG